MKLLPMTLFSLEAQASPIPGIPGVWLGLTWSGTQAPDANCLREECDNKPGLNWVGSPNGNVQFQQSTDYASVVFTRGDVFQGVFLADFVAIAALPNVPTAANSKVICQFKCT